MKKNLILTAILLLSTQLFAQTLTEQLGGVKTNFVFSSNGVEINVLNQLIIERGNYDYSIMGQGGYGYGYQSYWLEIQVDTFIHAVKTDKSIYVRNFIIEFYDKDNNLLQSMKYYANNIRNIKSLKNDKNAYLFLSFNLVDLQTIMLENVHRIDIVKYYGKNQKE